MKFGNRRGAAKVYRVKSYGEEIEITLRPLSALEVDQIRNEFPPPVPPKREEDGRTVADTSDPEYFAKALAWQRLFSALKVCRMIGSEEFGTSDHEAQTKLLRADFTEDEYTALLDLASQVGTGEVTPVMIEDAKERLAPFVNAGQEGSPT